MMHKKNILLSDDLTVYTSLQKITHSFPLLTGKMVSDGANTHPEIEKVMDLNELLISHPSETFFIRAESNAMEYAGINMHDILIVDRSAAVADNTIIVACMHDELMIKRIRQVGEHLFIMADKPDGRLTKITEDMDFKVWGVVTCIIRQV